MGGRARDLIATPMISEGSPEIDDGRQNPLLLVHLVSLFPTIFESWLAQGVVSRAIDRGIAMVRPVDLRKFGVGRHQVTDDYPFGGGAGMILKPEPLFAAIESLDLAPNVPVILLTPRGGRFDQSEALRLSKLAEFVLVSGHYEGVDERVHQHLIHEELSVGDFVLSAGELAAMLVVDATVRLMPGALAAESAAEESFSAGVLEYPQYTRPASFRGWEVPAVLLSGHHAEIERWRQEQSLALTRERRPDLIDS